MAFENYYVGSTLDSLGQGMVADRATDARLQAARMEQQRLAFQALQQALLQQQAQRQPAVALSGHVQRRHRRPPGMRPVR